MAYPTSPASFPTHVTGEVVRAAHLNAYADELEAVQNGWLNPFGQTTAPFRLRTTPALEFGDPNAAGGMSTLAHQSTEGSGYIALHGEPGTAANTVKTRGTPCVALAGSATGAGFIVANAKTASADNQALAGIMQAAPAGHVIFNGCPVCRLRHSTTQSINVSTLTACLMDTEDADPYNMHVAGASLLTIPAGMGGWYLITGMVRYGPQANGYRAAYIYLTGAQAVASMVRTCGNAADTILSIAHLHLLAAGDTVELRTQHAGAAATNVSSGTLGQQNILCVAKVA